MENKKKEKILKRKGTKIAFFILFLIIIAIGTSSGVFFYLKSQNSQDVQKMLLYIMLFLMMEPTIFQKRNRTSSLQLIVVIPIPINSQMQIKKQLKVAL